ncbi:MAG TPA: ADP-polyphosphate phosphotransferase [Burkholderiales bacterium]|nr:ADP-polyphosphate phosphotransferase [Burkholderiales bacterium]
MKIEPARFRVEPQKKIRLGKWPTRVKPYYGSKAEYQEMLGMQVAELSALQGKLYADNRYALLLIFQAMDAAGKDGVIKHVMSGVNPQGCQVYSFKHPSAEELDHDFLWRGTRVLPERGRMGIFNRSYYEEVLIVRVHPEILRAQNLPPEAPRGEELWKQRYESIAGLERHLHRNGIRILKFFLHLSKEEQRKRFLERIDDPEKNWKFTSSDIEERGYWKQYEKAYEACLPATSTRHAPWYVVPADDKRNARLIVSHIILDAMKRLDIRYPRSSAKHRRELRAIRRRLAR